ncbi:MAG: ECF transporter S component [Candidatus Njordarchaeia archaeon]
MDRSSYQTTALSAIFTAIVFVFTFIIRIQVPATGGYYNIGESGVYLAALIGGPIVGAIAGGVGSALSDLIGYPIFAPGTLVIKGFEGYVAGRLFRFLLYRGRDLKFSAIVSCLIGGFFMVLGYLLYETMIINFASALAEIPGNIGQVIIGVIIAVPVVIALREMGYNVGSEESVV